MKRALFIPFLVGAAVCWCLWGNVSAQQFANSDLNGTIGSTNIPFSWQSIPMSDPFCNASAALYATADVTGTTGPNTGTGLNGSPYSGNTFVSGLEMISGTTYLHEGIQQTISGFTIGQVYNIRLFQTVIKQSNALDQTGTWLVIINNTSLGQTAASFSSLAYNSNAQTWDQRDIAFTAPSNTITFKFLPSDDDNNHNQPNEAVRMGIDQISLTTTTILPWTADLRAAQSEDAVQLDWDMPEDDNAMAFNVERSADGINFEKISFQEGGMAGAYRAYDYYPFDDISYYRLAQLSTDGSIRYSNVASVSMALPLSAFVSGRTLRIRGAQSGPCDVQLLDMSGRVVYQNPRVEYEAELTGISHGVYLLRVVQGDQVVQKKIGIE